MYTILIGKYNFNTLILIIVMVVNLCLIVTVLRAY